MMNQNRTIKHRLLRKLLIVPIILGLFVVFSFTDKGSIIRYVPAYESVTMKQNEDVVPSVEIPVTMEAPKGEIKNGLKAMQDTLIIETTVTKTRKSDNDSVISKTTVADTAQYLELNRNQLPVSSIKTTSNAVRFIDVKEDRTLITFVFYINDDPQIINFPSNLSIQDARTLEKFPVNGIVHNIPFNKNLIVTGLSGKCVEVTLSFAPISSKTTEINILSSTLTVPQTYHSPIGSYKNLTIEKYKRVTYNYNDLTWEQTPTTSLGSQKETQLLSVVRTDNETLVTFSSYMYYDAQWSNFGNGIVIRDCKTKAKYYITRIEKDIPMNKLNVVRGKKGKFVMFTMVFPRLPDDVEKIDIIETPHVNDIPTPQGGERFNWCNISVKNNKFDATNSSNRRVERRTHPANRYVTIIESDNKPKMELEINNNSYAYLTITLTKNEVINIPYNFAIRDVASGKIFRAKSVRPYNFDMPVGGQRKDKIYIHFDNIPYGIDRVDLGVFTKDGEEPHNWSYKNLKINN